MAWNKFRVPILALTSCSTLFVVARFNLLPTPKAQVAHFNFPEKAPLLQWQFIESNPLPLKEDSEPMSQQRYQYIQNKIPLEIEMRYLETDGNIDALMRYFSSISSPLTMRWREGIGYYGVGVHKQRAYLSACISAKNGSTFTVSQFQQNLYFSNISLQRLLIIVLDGK